MSNANEPLTTDPGYGFAFFRRQCFSWVYLTIYPPTQPYLYKTLSEDWDEMTEDARQEELSSAAIELGWLGPYEYEETGRGDE